MIEINLIPDVKRELLRTRTMRNAVISLSMIIGIGAIGLAAVLGAVLGGQLATELWQDGQIKEKSDKLMAVSDLSKTVTIQHQLKRVSELHAEKRADSRLFDMVSAINPPAPNNVQFSSVKLNPEDKTIAIEGSAANGYIALEVLKKTIINTSVVTRIDGEEKKVPLASDIVAGDTSFGENSEGAKVLRFTFTFTYPDELFAVSKDPVTIVTPVGKIDVTDSKLGIPENLFSQKASDLGSAAAEGSR